MTSEFDFGFTSVNTVEVKEVIENTKKFEDLKAMIMPLLINLSSDGNNKDYIHWPFIKRKEEIEKLMKKIKEMTE